MLQAQPANATRQSILATLNANWRGWETNDRSAVEANLAEEFFDTDFEGVRRSKQDVLAFLSPKATPRSTFEITTSNHQISLLGKGSAVVSYQARDCRTSGAIKRCFDFSATDTLVFRKGRWLIAAGQQTMVPASANPEAARIEVLATQAALDQAQLVTDTDTFRALTTDEHLNREKFLEDMRTIWKPTRITRFQQTVQIVGETATVKGQVAYEWTSRAGVANTAREDITDVYVRQFGIWRRAASDGKCLAGGC